MTLTEFLAARLDEREASANEVHLPRGCGSIDRDGDFDPDPVWCGCGYPARVLREVAAGRRILAELNDVPADPSRDPSFDSYDPAASYSAGQFDALMLAARALASAWSDHPDYDPAWAPAYLIPDTGGRMAPGEIADHLEMFAARGAGAGALSAAGQAAAGYLDRPGVLGACLAFDTARLDWESHGRPWQAVADSARALAGALRGKP